MRRFINWRGFVGGTAIAAVGALIFRAFTGHPFWICFVSVLVLGMLPTGIIALFEDDWPGGFNNPDPPKRN